MSVGGRQKKKREWKAGFEPRIRKNDTTFFRVAHMILVACYLKTELRQFRCRTEQVRVMSAEDLNRITSGKWLVGIYIDMHAFDSKWV